MRFFLKSQSKFSIQSTTTNIFSMTITTNQSVKSEWFSRDVLVFLKFPHFSPGHKQTGSLGAAGNEVWIGDFNVEAWKTTEFILHKTWRSLKFCKLSAKQAHPCRVNNRSTLRSFTDYNPCYPEPCGNGKCTDVGDTYTCSCDDKYMGQNCSGNLVSVCMFVCLQSFLSVHVFTLHQFYFWHFGLFIWFSCRNQPRLR